MTTLVVQEIDQDGVVVTFVAATAAGDDFLNDGRTYLEIVNGGAGAVVVTADSKSNCNQGFDHDLTLSVGAGLTGRLGPFEPTRFNGADGLMDVTYDQDLTVTVAAVRLVQP